MKIKNIIKYIMITMLMIVIMPNVKGAANWDNRATDYDNGLVIEDANGNQFVWVPAGKYGYSYHYRGTSGGTTDKIGSGINEQDQITKYGGFWIARYEASNNGGKAASMQNKVSWVSTTYTNSKTVAEGFYVDKNAWEASLPTGKMWDTTLKFIASDGTNVNTDSRAWGNYKDSAVKANNGTVLKASGTSKVLNTGVTKYTMKKNIFDIAGNVEEWTLESSSTVRYGRGGYYASSGASYPASSAYNSSTSISSGMIGFRLALYLK